MLCKRSQLMPIRPGKKAGPESCLFRLICQLVPLHVAHFHTIAINIKGKLHSVLRRPDGARWLNYSGFCCSLGRPEPAGGRKGDFVRQGKGSWGSAREVDQAPGPGLLPHPSQAGDGCETRGKNNLLKLASKILKEERGTWCPPDLGLESQFHLLQ